MTDSQLDRIEEETELRQCGNPALVSCLGIVLSFLLGLVFGYLAWLWVSACP